MSDFSLAWALSRSRFVDTISDLNEGQLNWKIHPQALTIGEMALHLAGVELSFASQLTGMQLDKGAAKLKASATEGVVNANPFPFRADQITPGFVKEQLEFTRNTLDPIITNPSTEILTKQIVSALGPVITGEGAFSRLAFHSAYHQGQAYLIRTAPGFPVGP